MKKLTCRKEKGGCGKSFEVDETKCKSEASMQCPFCGELSVNPFYEGGENKVDYVT